MTEKKSFGDEGSEILDGESQEEVMMDRSRHQFSLNSEIVIKMINNLTRLFFIRYSITLLAYSARPREV
jgi:hypothetical protein